MGDATIPLQPGITYHDGLSRVLTGQHRAEWLTPKLLGGGCSTIRATRRASPTCDTGGRQHPDRQLPACVACDGLHSCPWSGAGRGAQPTMARTHRRAFSPSVMSGKWRRSSTTADSSPPSSQARRIASAVASSTRNMLGRLGPRTARASQGHLETEGSPDHAAGRRRTRPVYMGRGRDYLRPKRRATSISASATSNSSGSKSSGIQARWLACPA